MFIIKKFYLFLFFLLLKMYQKISFNLFLNFILIKKCFKYLFYFYWFSILILESLQSESFNSNNFCSTFHRFLIEFHFLRETWKVLLPEIQFVKRFYYFFSQAFQIRKFAFKWSIFNEILRRRRIWIDGLGQKISIKNLSSFLKFNVSHWTFLSCI